MRKKSFLLSIFTLLFTQGILSCRLADEHNSKVIETLKEVEISEEQKTIKLFMTLVNNHRMSLGLEPLVHLEELALIAKRHSEDMATNTVPFGHGGFSERCYEARTQTDGGALCAENVAMGQQTVTAAFNSWLSSSTHRAHIEDSRLTHTGLGFEKNSEGKYFWTQIFIEKN